MNISDIHFGLKIQCNICHEVLYGIYCTASNRCMTQKGMLEGPKGPIHLPLGHATIILSFLYGALIKFMVGSSQKVSSSPATACTVTLLIMFFADCC